MVCRDGALAADRRGLLWGYGETSWRASRAPARVYRGVRALGVFGSAAAPKPRADTDERPKRSAVVRARRTGARKSTDQRAARLHLPARCADRYDTRAARRLSRRAHTSSRRDRTARA